ncbi:hypothetical protein SASPL_130788 [Salvia splendens]|uniref:Uncharacterized protein n=1 Tax=Salvia splendens TaxID=180675 RepID=A0A8X8X4V2_SALSN|nr:hypothetical protein SASPL_130788 [Salvia splendens]
MGCTLTMEDSYLSRDNDDPDQTHNDLNKGRVTRKMKIDRTRRSWSPREEEVLLSNMKGLVVIGWKADNGFRGGYLSYYGGADKEARNMRFKSWPMWDAWKEIFGKDRAVGTTAADLSEMSKEVYSTGIPFLENGDSEYVASTGAPSGANPQNTKSSPQGLDQTASDNDTQSFQKKNKKRKVVDRSDILLEMLAKSNEDINSRLDKLTNRIGYEFDVSKARKEVFSILGDIQGLTLGQQLDAAGIILEKVQRLDLFMSLPDAFCHTCVVRMLEKHT